MQEMSSERSIEIPEAIRQVYRLWRPTSLYRARRLEQALETPARIYDKYEGVSPVGSHKANTSVAQVYYNKAEGVQRIATEIGAGQWGSALAMAGAFFGVDIEIFMVKISYQQKPYRRSMMQSFGARVQASPTDLTEAGRSILAQRRTPRTWAVWALPSARLSRSLRRVGAASSIPWAACSIMCCCTRPWWERRRCARWSWSTTIPMSSLAASEAAATWPGWFSFHS
uniref:tryptophan synthase n=1 Tax=Thermogemmatispora argillosa TaxID=2045280 RepID=A0A455T5X7_9CHLR|nr:hypothetical protein KTA_11430 [Thermogemmatispora argillosa]